MRGKDGFVGRRLGNAVWVDWQVGWKRIFLGSLRK